MGKTTANAKADTAVKLVLIFFISLLSFSVGTYVGKQVSDSDAHRASLEVEYDSHKSTVKDMASEAENAATAPITDEEVADLTEEFVNTERQVANTETHSEPSEKSAHADHEGYTHRAKSKEPAHVDHEGYSHNSKSKEPHPASSETAATTPAESIKEKAEHTPQPAAERVSHDKAPMPDIKKVRTPSSVLPSVATTAIGKYTVQVASYATEKEAMDQASKLTGEGYSAFFVPAEIKGKNWYRVSVGLFSDHKSATNYMTDLLTKKVVSSAIVQKIVK